MGQRLGRDVRGFVGLWKTFEVYCDHVLALTLSAQPHLPILAYVIANNQDLGPLHRCHLSADEIKHDELQTHPPAFKLTMVRTPNQSMYVEISEMLSMPRQLLVRANDYLPRRI